MNRTLKIINTQKLIASTIFTDRKANLRTRPSIPRAARTKDQLGIREKISGKSR